MWSCKTASHHTHKVHVHSQQLHLRITRRIYQNVITWSVCLCLSSKTLTQTSLWNVGIFGSDVTGGSPAEPSIAVSDGALQCAGWKAALPASSGGLQPAATPWSSSDYNQQDRSAQTLAYSATPTLTADVYMQTLCPSYTMLTYTHAPLLTNFGVSRTGEQKYVWGFTKHDFAKVQISLEEEPWGPASSPLQPQEVMKLYKCNFLRTHVPACWQSLAWQIQNFP